jgi:hypothetical protein
MNILNEVLKMDLQELRAFQMVINKCIESKISKTVSELQIGDTVKVNHHKVLGQHFNIIKINRKKCKVKQVNSGITYNVAMSLIEKI